jgi:small-conductance mechanosensitive channel
MTGRTTSSRSRPSSASTRSANRTWAARRDILRRVKIAFDLHDIEIPFPQRVTYAAGEQPVSKVLARHGGTAPAASHADVPARGETDPDA